MRKLKKSKKKLVNPEGIDFTNKRFGEDPELAALFDKLIKKLDKLKGEAAA